MEVIYTKHAENQLTERTLSKKLVEETLAQPDEILSDSSGNLVAHKIKAINGIAFLVRVFYTEEAGNKRILTIYLTTKIKKYYGRGLK